MMRLMAKSLYSYKWQQARAAYLTEYPLCVHHEAKGDIVVATVVDHKIPHRGDLVLFWKRSNWQSLCKLCHDSWKQRLEKTGNVVGCDTKGIPIDPNHHWNHTK